MKRICLIGIFGTSNDELDYDNLVSYREHIDCWMILGHNLTDEEKRRINSKLENIEGHIIDCYDPLESFSFFRNRIIRLAAGTFNPHYFIETDDSWGIAGFHKNMLLSNQDYYYCTLSIPEESIKTKCLKIYKAKIKGSIPQYIGRVHEILKVESDLIGFLPGCVEIVDYKLNLERTNTREDEQMLREDIKDHINRYTNLYHLGILMERKGRKQDANNFYSIIVQFCDDDPEMIFMALIRLAFLNQKLDYFHQALKVFPDRRCEVYYYLAKVTGDDKYMIMAEESYTNATSRLERNTSVYESIRKTKSFISNQIK